MEITAAPGTYSIVPSATVGSGLSNYTAAYVPGTLTVTPTSMSVTEDNWTPAGLTLMLGGDANLHVYVTRTTPLTDAVPPCAPGSVWNIQIASPSRPGYNLTIDTTNGNPIPAGGLNYSGGGGLIKTGAGSATLSDTNGFTGGVVVSSGTLEFTTAAALPEGWARAFAFDSGQDKKTIALQALDPVLAEYGRQA